MKYLSFILVIVAVISLSSCQKEVFVVPPAGGSTTYVPNTAAIVIDGSEWYIEGGAAFLVNIGLPDASTGVVTFNNQNLVSTSGYYDRGNDAMFGPEDSDITVTLWGNPNTLGLISMSQGQGGAIRRVTFKAIPVDTGYSIETRFVITGYEN